jgi:uncharacterized protein YggE
VSVRGEANVEVDPEIAVVFVSVTAREKDREQAVRRLEQRRLTLQHIFDTYADAIERIEGDAVEVHPDFKSGKPAERNTNSVASSSLRVTLSHFPALEELIGALMHQELVSVRGPDWRLRPSSPAFRQARLDAVQDAIRRARDYAEAVGGTVTELLELADVGLMAGGGTPHATAARAASLFRGAGPDEQVPISLTPEPQIVRGLVDARFAMTAPALDRGPFS